MQTSHQQNGILYLKERPTRMTNVSGSFAKFLSINLYYSNFKVIEYLLTAMPFREERLILNAKMLDIYLTPLQIRRFKVFAKLLNGDAKAADIYNLLVGLKREYFVILNCELFINVQTKFN